MLSILDRRLKAWHFWLANAAALAWFAGMSVATQAALPGVKLFRCPIGLCLGYYSPVELQTTLTKIGRNGREFLAETLLPLDMVLPALLLFALTITYVWFSRPGAAFAPFAFFTDRAFCFGCLFFLSAGPCESNPCSFWK